MKTEWHSTGLARTRTRRPARLPKSWLVSSLGLALLGVWPCLGYALELWSLNGQNGFSLAGPQAQIRSGGGIAGAGDVNGDGLADVIIGAPEASATNQHAGEAYIVFGASTGFASTFDLGALNGANGFRLTGTNAEDLAGSAVGSAGDINGDGFHDVAITAPYSDSNGNRSGETYIVFGSPSVFPATIAPADLDGSNGFVLRGAGDGASSGGSVSAGDVNNDGIDDVLITARQTDETGNEFGQVHVVFGTRAGFPAVFELASLDGSNGFLISGVAGGSGGTRISIAGDVNNDGIADIVIGSTGKHSNANVPELTYVVFGSASPFGPVLDLTSLDGSNGFALRGIDTADYSGISVSGAGDINADGIADIAIGAHFADPNGHTSGESYVVYGSAGTFAAVFDLASLDGTSGFVVNGVGAYDKSGSSVGAAGDVNGDGVDDLLIGAPAADSQGFSTGEVYVLFGSAAGFAPSIELSAIDSASGVVIRGIHAPDFAGEGVAGAGDVNGDGIADLIVSARGADANGRNSGQTYVIFGSTDIGAPVRKAGAVLGLARGGWTCQNVTTGQQVTGPLSHGRHFDCDAGGLQAQAGNTVFVTIAADAEFDAWYATSDIRGTVTGMSAQFAMCINLATGSAIHLSLTTNDWNCSRSGLVVDSARQQVVIAVAGIVQ